MRELDRRELAVRRQLGAHGREPTAQLRILVSGEIHVVDDQHAAGCERGDRIAERGELSARRVGEDQVVGPAAPDDVRAVFEAELDERRPAGSGGRPLERLVDVDADDRHVGAGAESFEDPCEPHAGTRPELEHTPALRNRGRERPEQCTDRVLARELEARFPRARGRFLDPGRQIQSSPLRSRSPARRGAHDTFRRGRTRGRPDMRSVIDTAEAVRQGELRARDLVDEALARIDERDAELNAFVVVAAEQARADADRIDAQIARGEDPGPLAGVPFGVKDMDRCAGLPTSFGSQLHKGGPPATEDSAHIGRLRAAGAIPVGITSSSEFGTVHWVRTRAWGVTRNPWNSALTPGGSSGGSAAAVAAGMVPFATAGDGGGSTRIPAAFTGLVGMKPSFGRIPREGAGTSQTAVWGALTTTVADAARHLDVSAGPDDRDRTSLPPPPVAYERAIEELHVAALRTVWSADLGFAAVDPEVRALAEDAAATLIDAASLQPIDRKVDLTDPVRAWLGVGAIDIWLHLAREDWPARAEVFGGHVRRSFEASAEVTAPRYAGILRRRTRLEHEVAELFGDVDVLLTPTTAVPAFAAEGPGARVSIDGREVEAALTVPFTMIANLCWNPAVSVPAGVTADRRPVGLQIMVRRHADEIALRLARILEQARPWPRLAPGA